jgi:hypothetical protein
MPNSAAFVVTLEFDGIAGGPQTVIEGNEK